VVSELCLYGVRCLPVAGIARKIDDPGLTSVVAENGLYRDAVLLEKGQGIIVQ